MIKHTNLGHNIFKLLNKMSSEQEPDAKSILQENVSLLKKHMKDPVIHAQNKTKGFDLEVPPLILINYLLYSTSPTTPIISRKILLKIKYDN